jgi:hypothetical protein
VVEEHRQPGAGTGDGRQGHALLDPEDVTSRAQS